MSILLGLAALVLSQVPVDTSCPAGMEFVAEKGCVAKIAAPACPGGTYFDGARCVAKIDRSCPSGMSFVERTGCVAQGPVASPPAADKPGAPPPRSDAYAESEIVPLVRSLAERQDMSREKVNDLVPLLEKAMGEWKFKQAVARHPIKGVIVYRGGEGGLLVKYMSAGGRVSFKNGRQAAPISLRTWSAGAQVGGSAMWGVVLVLGLASESHLRGDYTGEVVEATAGDEKTDRGLRFEPKEAGRSHLLWVVAAGRGLSANASEGKLTLTPQW